MKFSDIWNKAIEPVGSVVGDFVPYVGPAIKAINSFMPNNEKLPVNATKDEIKAAVDSLPPEQKAALMEKKVELEIIKEKEWSKVVDSLAKADATGNTTRPFIAAMMAWAICFAIVVFVSLWGVAVWDNKEDTLKAISDGWPMIVAVLATPTALLRAYFGMRTKEKTCRYNVATNQSANLGVIGGMIKAFTKR